MCDLNIHKELIILEQSICIYCGELLIEGNKEAIPCCNEPNIENLNGINTCIQCGVIHSCSFDKEYTDYHANLFKIRKKSVYIRFYHIELIYLIKCV